MARSNHPKVPALLLMVGMVLAIIVLALVSTFGSH
jgi:hypothetical protein